MKIQCSCGAKYAFDVTPEMAQHPIRFVCQTCGQDASDTVNNLIRQELSRATTIPAPISATPAPPLSLSVGQGAPVAAMAPSAPRMRIHVPEIAQPEGAATETDVLERCAKHAEPATEHCRVCSKPICPNAWSSSATFARHFVRP